MSGGANIYAFNGAFSLFRTLEPQIREAPEKVWHVIQLCCTVILNNAVKLKTTLLPETHLEPLDVLD